MIDDLTLNTSKLHRPAVTTAMIVRSRLVEQMQRGLAGPLTPVCAPAGYGKTTLVSAYLADSDHSLAHAAWLSIDEQDSEPADLPHEFVLVLDDYHAISGTAVPELLAGIARHWPDTLHLVLITRRNPLLPLASLRAKSQLVEVRSRNLQLRLLGVESLPETLVPNRSD
jgi:LuxR family maltose regulon positive regulatory protein